MTSRERAEESARAIRELRGGAADIIERALDSATAELRERNAELEATILRLDGMIRAAKALGSSDGK